VEDWKGVFGWVSGAYLQNEPMTNFVGSVCELFCSKPKICKGFWKTNFEPEPNNQLSDSYHKLVIRYPQVLRRASGVGGDGSLH
jgi:hypothetical protein